MTAAEELRREHFKESSTSTYAFCHKCGKPYPCLPIRALDEVQDEFDAYRDDSDCNIMYIAMNAAVDEVVRQLAGTQGTLRACEEIIARTRALAVSYERPPMTHAGMPLTEGLVPVSEILTALGPEPPEQTDE